MCLSRSSIEGGEGEYGGLGYCFLGDMGIFFINCRGNGCFGCLILV